jgi:hypothetical protein
LWFTTKCDQWGSQLASMTLEGSDVQEEPIPHGDTYCTKLEWSRWAPDRIFIHNTGVSPQHLSELDVSSGSAVPVVTDPWDWGSYNGAPISVTPDGLELLVSFGTGLASFDIDDMTGPTFTYDGWAVASDTTDAGGGLVAATYDTSVRLWQLGQFERLSNYALGASARGVAFSSDGSFLYAVAGGSSTMYFTRIDPTQQTSSLTLNADTGTVDYGGSVQLTAHLEGGATNTTVVLFGTAVGSTRMLLDEAVVDGNGNVTFTHVPTAKTTYQTEFAGDDDWSSSISPTVVVNVRHRVGGRMLRSYGSSGNYKLYHETKRVFYEASVQPPHPGKPVTIRLQFNFGDGWRSGGSESFQQNDAGKIVIYFAAGSLRRGRYRLQSSFGADTQHLAGVSEWDHFKVTR